MKWISCVLLIVVAACLPLSAQMDSLSTGKPTDQVDINNADYYYNKGLDYFAAGNQGYANLYFLKALNLNSAHKYARANLDLSVRMSADNKLYPEHLFLVQLMFKTLDFFSVNRLASLSLLLLLLAAISLVWLLFYNPEKERALPLLIFVLFLLLCISSFTSLAIKSHKQKHNQFAVLIAGNTQLLPMSETESKPLADIHAGLIFTLIETKGEYSIVRLPNGLIGRVLSAEIAKV
ncbi:MAG: hypothetical protein PHY48_05825 [Candidatus Cloacimonetes bacterium]|nr:hypothetical protein [Candidatus Cloacimonadota bacterium]